MPDSSTLLVFGAAALALIVVPGPAVLYIVAQSIDRGRLAGVVSALGVAVGGLVHVTAAAIGLSSLLVSSATAFNVVKYAGAGYLIGLGLWTILRRPDEPAVEIPKERKLSRRFWQGVVVNILNPKTALFFLAFLPQFVTEARGHVGEQIVALGVVFVLLGAVTDSLYALTASSAARWLRGQPRFLAGERWVTGGLYISLGLAAALSSTHRK